MRDALGCVRLQDRVPDSAEVMNPIQIASCAGITRVSPIQALDNCVLYYTESLRINCILHTDISYHLNINQWDPLWVCDQEPRTDPTMNNLFPPLLSR